MTPEQAQVEEHRFFEDATAVASSVADQEQWKADLYKMPSIRAAFPDGLPDMRTIDGRAEVWRVMLSDFRRRTPEHALTLLIAYISRYLRHFTQHVVFSIRDAGTSYYKSKMPTDILQRVRQDCGVYALVVAEELRRAAKGLEGMALRFELVITPEHATLVVFDVEQGHFYILNNAKFVGPSAGAPGGTEVLDELAQQYGNVMGLRHTVTPFASTTLGTTKDSDKRFQQQAWSRYTALASGFHLSAEPLHVTGTESERAAKAYQEFADTTREYDETSEKLRIALNVAHARLMGVAQDKRGEVLKEIASDLRGDSGPLLLLPIVFGRYGTTSRGKHLASSEAFVTVSKQADAIIENTGALAVFLKPDPLPLFRLSRLLKLMKQENLIGAGMLDAKTNTLVGDGLGLLFNQVNSLDVIKDRESGFVPSLAGDPLF